MFYDQAVPVFPHIRQPGVISQLPASLTPTLFCKKLPNPGGDFFAHIPPQPSYYIWSIYLN